MSCEPKKEDIYENTGDGWKPKKQIYAHFPPAYGQGIQTNTTTPRIDVIGQNGNLGLHYEDIKTQMIDEQAKQHEVFKNVKDELLNVTNRYGPFHSAHEGYAVLREELDEMWDEIKLNNTKKALDECVQVAAMAIKFLIDIKKYD